MLLEYKERFDEVQNSMNVIKGTCGITGKELSQVVDKYRLIVPFIVKRFATQTLPENIIGNIEKMENEILSTFRSRFPQDSNVEELLSRVFPLAINRVSPITNENRVEFVEYYKFLVEINMFLQRFELDMDKTKTDLSHLIFLISSKNYLFDTHGGEVMISIDGRIIPVIGILYSLLKGNGISVMCDE